MRLFAAGFDPDKTTTSDLDSWFSEFGKVTSVTIPLDKCYRKPRCFAFVNMPDSREALAAIEALHGKRLSPTRKLAVNEAKPLDNERADRYRRYATPRVDRRALAAHDYD